MAENIHPIHKCPFFEKYWIFAERLRYSTHTTYNFVTSLYYRHDAKSYKISHSTTDVIENAIYLASYPIQ